MNKITFYSLLVVALVCIIGCDHKTNTSLNIAFYNVENLFDTIDNVNVSDEKYLPESEVPWTKDRFAHKLDNISRVMKTIDPNGFPDLFGICEVENLGVIEDLIAHPDMSPANYRVIHKDSPDERGIDVALLYKPEIYTPISTQFIQPELWSTKDSVKTINRTRDILYSKGLVNKSDTLHLFINHWVSRWGGQAKTEPQRIQIALTIKSFCDSILKVDSHANIIIAGDLNDNPTDTSVYEVLSAKEVDSNPNPENLYNLSINQFLNGKGSLYYKSWDMFDQIIVSGSMLRDGNNLQVMEADQLIYKESWMLYQPKKGPARPSRTSSGKNYYGGFSDHLPVMVSIRIN